MYEVQAVSLKLELTGETACFLFLARCLPNQGPGLTCFVMLIDVIREFNRAVPFKPYEICTNGGERLRVPHPDFIMVAPRGTWVIVTDERDHPRHISSILIEEIAPLRKSPSRRRSRKRR
jgi:hypothetical protein